MIIDSALAREITAYARASTSSEEDAAELASAILTALYEIEREDDKHGTRELDHILENTSIARFADDRGLADQYREPINGR